MVCLCVYAQDDTPDEWLPDSLVAPDLVEDWTSGLERAPVTALLDVQQWGTSREYLVQWADGRPDSWEDESHIPQVRGTTGKEDMMQECQMYLHMWCQFADSAAGLVHDPASGGMQQVVFSKKRGLEAWRLAQSTSCCYSLAAAVWL